jgi:hypothetical protein
MNPNYCVDVHNCAAMVQEALKGETRIDGLKEFFDIQFETDKIRKEELFETIPDLEDIYEWTQENL